MASLPPVLFEDDSLAALAKPAGLPVGAAAGAGLLDLARARFGAGASLAHRIDDEASGLVLCARTKPSLDYLSGQFQAKTVEAVFHVLTAGAPADDSGVIELVLKEDEAAPGRMCIVKKHGQKALTEFQVRQRFGRFAWLECRPRTSRRHQLRVHLAAVGAPVLNDRLYGNGTVLLLSDLKRGYKGREDERPLIGDLALHGAELAFSHPLTRARMTLNMPLPKDFAIALKYLQRFAK